MHFELHIYPDTTGLTVDNEGIVVEIELPFVFSLTEPLATIDLSTGKVERVDQWVWRYSWDGEETLHGYGPYEGATGGSPEYDSPGEGDDSVVARAQAVLANGLTALLEWSANEAEMLKKALEGLRGLLSRMPGRPMGLGFYSPRGRQMSPDVYRD